MRGEASVNREGGSWTPVCVCSVAGRASEGSAGPSLPSPCPAKPTPAREITEFPYEEKNLLSYYNKSGFSVVAADDSNASSEGAADM